MIYPWRALIDHECEVEKSETCARREVGLGGLCLFCDEAVQFDRIAVSGLGRGDDTQNIDDTLRLRPNATIFLRPHPLAANEAYLQDILKELNNPQIVVTFAHPEILLRLARRTIVNAPTNILFTSGEGRFIDCSDYRERDIDARHGEGFAAGYATLSLNPNTSDFDDRFTDALETDYWAGNPYIASGQTAAG